MMERDLETYCSVTCKCAHSVVNDMKFLFVSLFIYLFFTNINLVDLQSEYLENGNKFHVNLKPVVTNR
jgi:hypothetical protein